MTSTNACPSLTFTFTYPEETSGAASTTSNSKEKDANQMMTKLRQWETALIEREAQLAAREAKLKVAATKSDARVMRNDVFWTEIFPKLVVHVYISGTLFISSGPVLLKRCEEGSFSSSHCCCGGENVISRLVMEAIDEGRIEEVVFHQNKDDNRAFFSVASAKCGTSHNDFDATAATTDVTDRSSLVDENASTGDPTLPSAYLTSIHIHGRDPTLFGYIHEYLRLSARDAAPLTVGFENEFGAIGANLHDVWPAGQKSFCFRMRVEKDPTISSFCEEVLSPLRLSAHQSEEHWKNFESLASCLSSEASFFGLNDMVRQVESCGGITRTSPQSREDVASTKDKFKRNEIECHFLRPSAKASSVSDGKTEWPIPALSPVGQNVLHSEMLDELAVGAPRQAPPTRRTNNSDRLGAQSEEQQASQDEGGNNRGCNGGGVMVLAMTLHTFVGKVSSSSGSDEDDEVDEDGNLIVRRFLFVGSSDCKVSIYDASDRRRKGEKDRVDPIFTLVASFPAHVNMVTCVVCADIPVNWLPPPPLHLTRPSTLGSASGCGGKSRSNARCWKAKSTSVLLTASRDGRVCVWDLSQLARVAEERYKSRVKRRSELEQRTSEPPHDTADNRNFSSTSAFWRPTLLKRIRAHVGFIQSLVMLRYNSHAGTLGQPADGGSDGVNIDDLNAARCCQHRHFPTEEKSVLESSSAAAIPFIGLFATGSADRYVKVWSLRAILATPAEHDINANEFETTGNRFRAHEPQRWRRRREEIAEVVAEAADDQRTEQIDSGEGDNYQTTPGTGSRHQPSPANNISSGRLLIISEDFGMLGETPPNVVANDVATPFRGSSNRESSVVDVGVDDRELPLQGPHRQQAPSPIITRFETPISLRNTALAGITDEDRDSFANLAPSLVYGDTDERSMPMPPTYVAPQAITTLPHDIHGVDSTTTTGLAPRDSQPKKLIAGSENCHRDADDQSLRRVEDLPCNSDAAQNGQEKTAMHQRSAIQRPLSPLFFALKLPDPVRVIAFAAPSLLCVGHGEMVSVISLATRTTVGVAHVGEMDFFFEKGGKR